MMTDISKSVRLVPIDRIEELNSRDRDMKVLEAIVENTRSIGLKKPTTATEREGADGAPAYLLVCGEGRLNAFRLLGESHIPVLVINVTDEGAFIMSLAENTDRRSHRPLEILADIELLLARHYTIDDKINRTGLSEKYVRNIVFLLEKGEERLIEAVQNCTIQLTTGLEIARAKHDDENLGDMLEDAYKTGQLKGHQITDARRLIEKGPKTGGDRPKLPNSAHSPDGVMTTRKFKQIVSSIREIRLIEPLSVIKPDPDAAEFLLLDGNILVLALKELGQDTAPCLIAKNFKTYIYNHRINPLSTVQEHYMLRRAIDKGVSKERVARAFNVNLSTMNSRINLLQGICPKAVELLQDHQFTPDVTRHLRKMKAARQIETVELMIAASTITATHADSLLKATLPEQPKGDPLEQFVKLEREMSQVQEKYKHAEENYGSELLNLIVAKSYLKKLMENEPSGPTWRGTGPRS